MELQRAWMLHSRPYKEQSVIAEFLVENHGRIAMVVKGVRRARSSQAALLQPFNTLLLSWKGRSDLKTLVSLEPFINIRLSGNALYCGFYINELLLRAMIPGQDMEGVADLYQNVIKQLSINNPSANHLPLEPVLRQFELSLLELAGYLPELSVDASSGHSLHPQALYRFQQDDGFYPVPESASEMVRKESFFGALLLALSQSDYSRTDYYPGFKRFTRLALRPILGNRPLQSRLLFKNNSNSAREV